MNKIKDKKQIEILVVEDNQGDFTLIQDYLEERFLSPKIIWAKNFKIAQSILVNIEFKADLVLLDLTLPDKSGRDLINHVIPLCHAVPLVILTGYSDIDFGITLLSLGVSDYLIKDELNAASLHKSVLYNIERKKTQIQLENSEKRYNDLFHLSPIPMYVFDIQTLQFLDVNVAAEMHYGYSLQEFLSMTIRDIRPIEDLPHLMESVKTLSETDPEVSKGIFRHKRKNGELIYVDIKCNTIRFKNTTCRIILANDITERFTYIEAIEKQNAILNEIAWIQSHLVRAPLSRIMGIIDAIKNKGFDSTDNEKLYEYLLISAEELDIIIGDITKKSEQIKPIPYK
jgi:PAS domain S-box-containing protein